MLTAMLALEPFKGYTMSRLKAEATEKCQAKERRLRFDEDPLEHEAPAFVWPPGSWQERIERFGMFLQKSMVAEVSQAFQM